MNYNWYCIFDYLSDVYTQIQCLIQCNIIWDSLCTGHSSRVTIKLCMPQFTFVFCFIWKIISGSPTTRRSVLSILHHLNHFNKFICKYSNITLVIHSTQTFVCETYWIWKYMFLWFSMQKEWSIQRDPIYIEHTVTVEEMKHNERFLAVICFRIGNS